MSVRGRGRRMDIREIIVIMTTFQDKHIAVRKALPGDAKNFADLMLLSSPTLFPTIYGDEVKSVMQYLFRKRRNLFSFEHTYFAELDGRKAGMIVEYDWRTKRRENWRTGFLLLMQMRLGLLTKLPLLMKVEDVIGMVGDKESYISNVAVYPEFRVTGLGSRLIFEVEGKAKKNGAEKVALEVEVENAGAIRLYERLGYSIVSESEVILTGGKSFHFYRMCKEL